MANNTLVTNSIFVKRTSIKSVLMYILGIVHILIEPNTFNDKYVYVPVLPVYPDVYNHLLYS